MTTLIVTKLGQDITYNGELDPQRVGLPRGWYPKETGLYVLSLTPDESDILTIEAAPIPTPNPFEVQLPTRQGKYIFKGPGVIIVTGEAGSGKSYLLNLLADNLGGRHYSIGEPESPVAGNAHSYGALFLRIFNRGLRAQSPRGRVICLDSIQPFAIMGESLGKEGLAKTILTGPLPLLTGISGWGHYLTFVSINPQLSQTRLREFTDLVAGAVHGVIAVRSGQRQGPKAVFDVQITVRPERVIEQAIIEIPVS
jgi:hypothetical protein